MNYTIYNSNIFYIKFKNLIVFKHYYIFTKTVPVVSSSYPNLPPLFIHETAVAYVCVRSFYYELSTAWVHVASLAI